MPSERRITWTRAVFGPWPLVPVPVFAFGTLAYLNRAILVAGVSGEGTIDYLRTLVTLGLIGAVATGLAMVPIILIGGWRGALRISARNRRLPSRTAYLTACVLAATVVGVLQVLSRYLALDEVTGRGVFQSIPIAFVTSFAIAFLFALLVMNAVGIASFLIQRQTVQLERQIRQLERQQRLIVEADQRVRTEVAEALHDDVQGALLRSTLRLSRIAEAEEDPLQADAVRSVIADLESLRGSGVRAISRRLAPPLASVGLVGALEDLAASYVGSIDVAVDIDRESERAVSELSRDHQLAIFRIIEQALLNASGHARANTATIVIRAHDDAIRVDIIDDGAGLADEVRPGHGSAVIDAWMTIVGGTWALEPADTGGARLRADLAVT